MFSTATRRSRLLARDCAIRRFSLASGKNSCQDTLAAGAASAGAAGTSTRIDVPEDAVVDADRDAALVARVLETLPRGA